MRVLLIGGTGVFGSRLARLLVRDGHGVTLAGRTLHSAQSLASELGCHAIQLDRNGPLDMVKDYDVVVDAAGPYHAYEDDPYRLPRAASVCVVCGLSSVPALPSAAARALADDSTPQVIETAILSQVGRPMKFWRGGRWAETTGWSGPKLYVLPDSVTRQGWQIEVPDQRLFPAHFKAETVIFRAGLELGGMRYGLWAFACLRRWVPIPINGPVLRGFKLAADMLSPFGTDRGEMSAAVTQNGRTHWWRLLAEADEGPFIPAVAARALLRRPSLLAGLTRYRCRVS
ncbi:saccharopine dehydrogenase NADP-binding domain-containing protein [Aliiroseovarius halocynthiae]|uniref:saccharopine dehydrogenase NADP-binding domain-containing protein n=1 Tax=Aliiroseovarius halocynthiae TaxID=985055 RepID=UPI001FE3884F|nr:saccharopine dehydrogenase NADP-binding domain-containing protein [Aliiroseovarius halocynthiae]